MWPMLVLIVGCVIPAVNISSALFKAQRARDLAETARDNAFVEPPEEQETEVDWSQLFATCARQMASLALYVVLVQVLVSAKVNTFKLILLWIPLFVLIPSLEFAWQHFVMKRRISMLDIQESGERNGERNAPIWALIGCQIVVDILNYVR